MKNEDIEAQFKLNIDAIDIERVQYHHVFEGILKQGKKKVKREGRYDTEEGDIELRTTYFVNGEMVEKDDWVVMASHSVQEENCITGPDRSWEGENTREVMTKFFKSDFLVDPEAELGEIFHDVITRG